MTALSKELSCDFFPLKVTTPVIDCLHSDLLTEVGEENNTPQKMARWENSAVTTWNTDGYPSLCYSLPLAASVYHLD